MKFAAILFIGSAAWGMTFSGSLQADFQAEDGFMQLVLIQSGGGGFISAVSVSMASRDFVFGCDTFCAFAFSSNGADPMNRVLLPGVGIDSSYFALDMSGSSELTGGLTVYDAAHRTLATYALDTFIASNTAALKTSWLGYRTMTFSDGVATTGGEAVTVPEPATWMMLAGALLLYRVFGFLHHHAC